MTDFVNNDVSSGAIIYASDHNEQGSRIAAVLNGGIDNNNLASNAGISTAKLADDAVTAAKIDFGGAGTGVWWEEIGRTTLGTAGTSIAVSFAQKTYLLVLMKLHTSSTSNSNIQFNSDSSSHYAYRRSLNGGADSTNTSQTYIEVSPNYNNQKLTQLYVLNTGAEKMIYGQCSANDATGAGTINNRAEYSGKWVNASAVTSLNVSNPSVNFDIGSEVVVLGHD